MNIEEVKDSEKTDERTEWVKEDLYLFKLLGTFTTEKVEGIVFIILLILHRSKIYIFLLSTYLTIDYRKTLCPVPP